jgi:hypothetical protein
LEFAVVLLLEKLSPTERAAYVLHEAFDYSYQAIADVLKLTEANIRQLVSRARKHISDGRRATVSAGEQRRLLVAFIDAAQKGDTAVLEELFAADISPTRMVAGSCGRRGCRFPVVSALRSSSRRLLRTFGLV